MACFGDLWRLAARALRLRVPGTGDDVVQLPESVRRVVFEVVPGYSGGRVESGPHPRNGRKTFRQTGTGRWRKVHVYAEMLDDGAPHEVEVSFVDQPGLRDPAEVDLSQLPPAIRSRATADRPGLLIERVQRSTSGPERWEVKGRDDRARLEIKYDSEGSMLEIEVKPS